MSEPRRCPDCDIEIPINSPIGLCPRCLLKAGTDSQSVSVEFGPTNLIPPTSGFVPPTPEELAKCFPQLEILELLGKGGMGAVYKARQPGLDRIVAIKILPPEISHDPAFAERFQREARALARLSHPHIVAVYDFGETGNVRRGSPTPPKQPTEGLPPSKPQETFGQSSGSVGDRPQQGSAKNWPQQNLCYIVMEFVDGANLRQAIRTGKLTSQEALAIVPQICEALQFAHDEGIVHRDIKPENILIDKRGRVKIADFGLAKLLGQDAGEHSLTATHQVMGTLRYMAPEQMQGSREVDHRADIYSLGVVFYELLTGELPMGKFAPPSKRVQVDVRLDEVVLRALEQDPEQRYQHASDVKSEIDSIRTTPAPLKPVEQRDPLEPFREVARSAMTPQPSYAKRVGIPMAILFGLFSMVTIAAHSVYGQKDNYQERPLVLILSNGAILLWLIIIILHITFFARRRASMQATPTRFDDSGRAIQSDVTFPRWLLITPRDLFRTSVLEIVTAVAVALAFAIAAAKGIYELAQRPSPLDGAAMPATALAAMAACVLLIVHQFRRPSGSRAALPELFIAILAACAGSLPWTAVFSPIAGWNFWQGAVFASLNFGLSLFLLVTSNSRPHSRAIATLLVGLISFALVMQFNIGPVGVIGGSEFLTTITRKPGLPGMFIAAALSLLAMIAGSLQLRAATSETNSSSLPDTGTRPT